MRAEAYRSGRRAAIAALTLIGLLALGTVWWVLSLNRQRLAEFQRGVAFASWQRGEFASAKSDETLAEAIQPTGATWISLIVTCYQDTPRATQIDCDGDHTASDEDVLHAIRQAHGLGIRVMLKPHIDLADPSRWRGEIGFGHDEEAWRAWFAAYTDFITRYAALAETANADYFVVGTELVETSGRADDWRRAVEAVRSNYRGPITYAANHDGEELAVQWWDAVDAIGVDAYYPLTESNQPTVGELREAWEPIVARLGALSRQWDRPIILTEIGYQSANGANRAPWGVPESPVDLQEQADCYQAALEALAGKDWLRGMYWWAWDTNPAQGDPNDGTFSPHGKPAEEVLRRYYANPAWPKNGDKAGP